MLYMRILFFRMEYQKSLFRFYYSQTTHKTEINMVKNELNNFLVTIKF